MSTDLKLSRVPVLAESEIDECCRLSECSVPYHPSTSGRILNLIVSDFIPRMSHNTCAPLAPLIASEVSCTTSPPIPPVLPVFLEHSSSFYVPMLHTSVLPLSHRQARSYIDTLVMVIKLTCINSANREVDILKRLMLLWKMICICQPDAHRAADLMLVLLICLR